MKKRIGLLAVIGLILISMVTFVSCKDGGSGTQTPEPVTISSILLNTANVKKNFYQGENIVYDGLVIEKRMSDGSKSAVSISEVTVTTDYNSNIVAQYTVTVTLKSDTTKKATYKVNVKENQIQSLEIETPADRTLFVLGEDISYYGLTIKATMAFGAPKILTPNSPTIQITVSPELSSDTEGTYTVTISAKNNSSVSTFYEIEIVENTIQGISVDPTSTHRVEFYLDENISYDGLIVGVEKVVGGGILSADDFDIESDYDWSTVGDYTVTITLKDDNPDGDPISTTYIVSVVPEYVGRYYTWNGGKVNAISTELRKDGTATVVGEGGYEYTVAEGANAGEYTITFTKAGKSNIIATYKPDYGYLSLSFTTDYDYRYARVNPSDIVVTINATNVSFDDYTEILLLDKYSLTYVSGDSIDIVLNSDGTLVATEVGNPAPGMAILLAIGDLYLDEEGIDEFDIFSSLSENTTLYLIQNTKNYSDREFLGIFGMATETEEDPYYAIVATLKENGMAYFQGWYGVELQYTEIIDGDEIYIYLGNVNYPIFKAVYDNSSIDSLEFRGGAMGSGTELYKVLYEHYMLYVKTNMDLAFTIPVASAENGIDFTKHEMLKDWKDTSDKLLVYKGTKRIYNGEPITEDTELIAELVSLPDTGPWFSEFVLTPAKTEFLIGEDFSYEGMTAKGYVFGYDGYFVILDSTAFIVTSNGGYDSNTEDEYTIVVLISYRGHTEDSASYKVTVINGSRVASVVMSNSSNQKTVYAQGETFSAADIWVKTTSVAGNEAELTGTSFTDLFNIDTGDFDGTVPGDYVITIILKSDSSVTASYTVTVLPSDAEEMVLDLSNVKTDYGFGEEFTADNLVVAIKKRSTGETITLDSSEYDIDYSSFDSSVRGTYTITVYSNGWFVEETFDVEVDFEAPGYVGKFYGTAPGEDSDTDGGFLLVWDIKEDGSMYFFPEQIEFEYEIESDGDDIIIRLAADSDFADNYFKYVDGILEWYEGRDKGEDMQYTLMMNLYTKQQAEAMMGDDDLVTLVIKDKNNQEFAMATFMVEAGRSIFVEDGDSLAFRYGVMEMLFEDFYAFDYIYTLSGDDYISFTPMTALTADTVLYIDFDVQPLPEYLGKFYATGSTDSGQETDGGFSVILEIGEETVSMFGGNVSSPYSVQMVDGILEISFPLGGAGDPDGVVKYISRTMGTLYETGRL